MPLRIELAPFEKVFLGSSLLTNSDRRAMFIIEGSLPLLREKDALTAAAAQTTAEKAYLCIQNIYLEGDIFKYSNTLDELLKKLERLDSDTIRQVRELMSAGKAFQALKTLKKLPQDWTRRAV